MNQEKLEQLLREYFDDTISETDCVVLLNYLSNANPDTIINMIDEHMLGLNSGPDFKGFKKSDVFRRIQSDPRFAAGTSGSDEPEEPEPKVVKFYQRRWLKIAITILIAYVGLGLYLINKKTSVIVPAISKTKPVAPIVPGGNKATLTLANGKVIVLDSVNNGLIASTGKANVFKNSKGLLVYNSLASAQSSAQAQNALPVYNTLSTPKGGEFQVVLPDGTKVWLNSASSLTYPTEFTGNDRRVELTGEAYFEVAKNKEKPFYVNANNVEVRVLGTHFNIAAYLDDNDITTTLLEGSVQVKNKENLSVISPGYQAIVNNNADGIKVKRADIEKVMAWKNGYFIFYDEDITSIMKKISRWYDVDVEYRGNFGNMRFGGTFYRFKGINELLLHIEQIGNVHFKIAGRRIIVMA